MDRRVAILVALLAISTGGCIDAITGHARLSVTAENTSNVERATKLHGSPSGGGAPFDIDLGTVPPHDFRTAELRLDAGDHTLIATSGELRAERAWKIDGGAQGITLRITDEAIEFIKIAID